MGDASGRLTARWKDGALCVDAEGAVLRGRLGIEADGQTLWSEGDEGRFAWSAPALRCNVSVEAVHGATALAVRASLTNVGTSPVALGRCRLLEGVVEMDAEETVVLVCSGSTGPTRVRRVAGATHRTKTLAQLYDPRSGLAVHSGFVTLDRMNTEHEVCAGEDGKVALSSFCDFAGWELPPGETVETERLVLRVGDDPTAGLEAWADDVAESYRPSIWPKIPAGWVGWAWVDGFNVEPYESVVLRNTEAIRRRLPGHDLEYVWVSIGNLKDGLPGNWLEWNHDLFPRGVDFLVRELGQRGFRLGLWMGSFWIAASSADQLAALGEALLHKDGQPMVTCDRWNYGACGRLPVEQRPALYALDPTHPKTHAWLREALTTYYRWGVRYYMIDFLHAVSDSTPGDFLPDGYHDHRLIRGPQTYRTGLQVIREAAGPDTYLLSSTGATYQHVGLLDACRVGNDYGEGRSLNPESYFYPATFVINSAGFWTSHRGATDALAAGYFTHRKLYLADSGNLLTVDKPIPVGDAQISATIFGINGGPMMLGDDIDRMAEERLALVRQCLPRLPECARPIDLFDSPEPDYVKVFDLPVRTDWDAWEIVAVFNYSPEVLRQTIEPERLGLDPRAEHVVWDFWNERYEGVRTGAFEVCVPPNAVKVLRLAPRRDHPWVLSTDMHVRQGQAEIAACRWDADAMALTLRVSRPAGEEGSVFLHAPQGLAVANPEGLWIAKDGHDGTLIIRLAFAFEGGETERVVRFTER